MKRLLILFSILVFFLIFSACATTGDFPPYDIVVGANTALGPFSLVIEKGDLNPERKGDIWIKKEDYDKLKKQAERDMEI